MENKGESSRQEECRVEERDGVGAEARWKGGSQSGCRKKVCLGYGHALDM